MKLTGTPYPFAGQLVLDGPVELAAGCTRKTLLVRTPAVPGGVASTAVRLRDGRVVVIVPPAIGARAGEPTSLEVELGRDARPIEPPADLDQALRCRGLSLDGLPDHERRHLVSMVREARSPEVRAARIAAVLSRIEERST